jgi:hypothetical protein
MGCFRTSSASLPWPLRSVIAGAAGTAALTVAYSLERRVRPGERGPLDYDDSLVPGQIVATILHLPSVTGRAEAELGQLLRWSYGSMFGLWHGVLRRRFSEPQATAAFAGTLIGATVTMFPLLGHTPPPWRWPRGYLLTSFGTHAIYAIVVGTVDDRLRVRR